jgi:hypothetical protein
MSGSPQAELDRRQFITGGAAGVAATVAGGTSQTGSPFQLWVSAPKTSVVLHDPRISIPAEVLHRLDANGIRRIALDGDPVWFWRSAAGVVLRDPSTTLLGITSWAELLIFRGLAAETRRHLRNEKLNTATGAFIWLVA